MRPALAMLLAGANFAVALGYGAILPLLPALLGSVSAGEPRVADGLNTGGLTGAYMFAVFLGAPAWGGLADRLGRRPILVTGLLGYAVSLVALAAARDLATAYGLRAVAGLFAGAVLPVVSLRLAEVADVERRGRLFAATGAASLLGFLFGPALSGTIAQLMLQMSGAREMSAQTVAWSLGASAVVAIVVAFAAARAPGLAHERPAGAAEHRAGPRLRELPRALLAANFLVLFGIGAFEVLVPLVGPARLGLDTAGLATLFAECSLVMIAVQAGLFLTPALTRVPGRALVAAGFVTMAAGTAWLALAGTLAAAYWGTGLIAAAAGWLLPAIGFIATLGRWGATGMLLGALTAAASLGQAVGSAAGGWLFDRIAGGAFWVVAAALAAGIALARVRVFQASAAAARAQP